MKVAVLDDYQSVAADMADWSSLPAGIDVTYFSDHLADEDALAERLADFDIVMGMRERTPFPRTLLERLPALRCLITTGGGNASFDLAAATDLGITVCATPGAGEGPTELTWGLILGMLRQIPQRRPGHPGGWQVGHPRRGQPPEQDAGAAGPGAHRVAGGPGGQRIRDADHRVEPEPHRRASGGVRRDAGGQGHLVRGGRYSIGARAVERPDARAGGSARNRPDEIVGHLGQHLPRAPLLTRRR